MKTFRPLFEEIRAHVGMHIFPVTFGSAAALVYGYDLACQGGLLAGFREWLIPRVGKGNNLAWDGLVLQAAFPDSANPLEVVEMSVDNQSHAIDVLFQMIADFDDARTAQDGLRRIYNDYERWLRTQDWYGPQSPSWIECPCSNPVARRGRRGPARSST